MSFRTRYFSNFSNPVAELARLHSTMRKNRILGHYSSAERHGQPDSRSSITCSIAMTRLGPRPSRAATRSLQSSESCTFSSLLHPRKRSCPTSFHRLSPKISRWTTFTVTLLIICSLAASASAALIPFENCLGDNILNPAEEADRMLQWVPLFVDASYDTEDGRHTLTVTVWGNVTGHFYLNEELPSSPDHPDWTDPGVSTGKILENPEPDAERPVITTLQSKVNVLTYEPWNNVASFCGSLDNGECPLAPVFNTSDVYAPTTSPWLCFGIQADPFPH